MRSRRTIRGIWPCRWERKRVNLTSMLARMYRKLRYTSAPPAAITTRLTDTLNEAHREILSLPGMAHLRDDVLPVTALANVARTGLPVTVARIYAITDRTNNHRLVQVPLSELRSDDPAQAFTGGYPMRYALIGNQAVVRQPATTGLWVVSSSASDTTQKAYVESVITGGYPQTYVSGGTAINGTTRVQIGTLTSHIEVTRFYIDLATAVGFISLYDAAVAGNELARLPVGQTFSRYQAVEWWPIQTADVTEYADYQRVVFDFVNGTDEPLLPVDFHGLVVSRALMDEYELTDDTRWAIEQAKYTKGVKDLQSWVLTNPDRIASLRYTPARWSQLGAMYPAGS